MKKQPEQQLGEIRSHWVGSPMKGYVIFHVDINYQTLCQNLVTLRDDIDESFYDFDLPRAEAIDLLTRLNQHIYIILHMAKNGTNEEGICYNEKLFREDLCKLYEIRGRLLIEKERNLL